MGRNIIRKKKKERERANEQNIREVRKHLKLTRLKVFALQVFESPLLALLAVARADFRCISVPSRRSSTKALKGNKIKVHSGSDQQKIGMSTGPITRMLACSLGLPTHLLCSHTPLRSFFCSFAYLLTESQT